MSPRLYARASRSRTVAAMGLTRATFKRPVVVDTAVAALVAVPTTLDAWWNVPGTRQVDELTYSLVVVSIARAARATTVAGGGGGDLRSGAHGLVRARPSRRTPELADHRRSLHRAAQGNRRRSLFVGAAAVLWSSALVFSVDTSSASFASDFGYPVTETLWPIVGGAPTRRDRP